MTTKTKTPTYKITSWFDERYHDEATRYGPTMPRVSGPDGRQLVEFTLSCTELTTDDLHRELDRYVRKEHTQWELSTVPYTGLIGHGDGWWHCAGAELWYRVR